MTAQAASRAREMALRVSIGASRARLVQLVLVESVWLAIVASALGALFAWWAAPFVVSMINPPDNPARLYLPFDWRVSAFGLALALIVTCLFGLAPALRASAVKPVHALEGRRRSACVAPRDARADRRAGRLLRVRAVRGGIVRRHVRAARASADGLFGGAGADADHGDGAPRSRRSCGIRSRSICAACRAWRWSRCRDGR